MGRWCLPGPNGSGVAAVELLSGFFPPVPFSLPCLRGGARSRRRRVAGSFDMTSRRWSPARGEESRFRCCRRHRRLGLPKRLLRPVPTPVRPSLGGPCVGVGPEPKSGTFFCRNLRRGAGRGVGAGREARGRLMSERGGGPATLVTPGRLEPEPPTLHPFPRLPLNRPLLHRSPTYHPYMTRLALTSPIVIHLSSCFSTP